jgi:RNA-directed DNA polymerase
MQQAKPYEIPKSLIWDAYKKVNSNKGSAGIDGLMLHEFNQTRDKRLYKLWNRMSSGSYMPSPVKQVDIPKSDGGIRTLGIPTVDDRIAQTVVKTVIEPRLETLFSDNSFGYRPNRSAHDAIRQARKNCWRYDWVIDLDIKSFFDEIEHELMMKAVKHHVKERWILLYIERWLTVPSVDQQDNLKLKERGTPQGGVISPLLANLFLHYVFDNWMETNTNNIPFERFADDIVCHCASEKQAKWLMKSLNKRFNECGLTLHPHKSKLVYCKDNKRTKEHPITSFDFLGYTFQRRAVRTKTGELFIGFNPAMSRKSAKAIRNRVRSWKLGHRTTQSIEEIATLINPIVRGWIYYFGQFHGSKLHPLLNWLNTKIASWATKKFKRLGNSVKAGKQWLVRCMEKRPQMFIHWTTLYVRARYG